MFYYCIVLFVSSNSSCNSLLSEAEKRPKSTLFNHELEVCHVFKRYQMRREVGDYLEVSLMRVWLYKMKRQKQTVIKVPERNVKVVARKKGFVILKVPYRATTQNRLLVDLERKHVEAWMD